MKIKINWVYEGEAGYWRSSEGRFSIYPDGFRSGVTPDYYSLHDKFAKSHDTSIPRHYDTVREAKAEALVTATIDMKKEIG